jgi:hypothetical protein
MPEQQLSIRSTRARKLAHKYAKAERRTLSQVVEAALEQYGQTQSKTSANRETAAEFYDRLRRDFSSASDADIDLAAIAREGRVEREDPMF